MYRAVRQMSMIEIKKIRCSLDFMLMADYETPVVLSFFDRSSQVVRSIGAGLQSKHVVIKKTTYPYSRTCHLNDNEGFDVFISPVVYGKEKFYHGLAISKRLNKKFILSTEDKMTEHFYHFLMKNFDLPLLREWSDELLNDGIETGKLELSRNCLLTGRNSLSASLPLGKEKIPLSDIRVLSSELNETTLEEQVSSLLKEKRIWISKQKQIPLEFDTMDSYFSTYGHALVENLEKQIEPLMELNGNIDNMCLRNMRLYPQQAAQVNAVVKRLQNASYCILNNGMGTGKTIEGASICEAYHVDKWLRSHPGKSLKDAYSDPMNINYRVIVMCPGHLVSKWASEIGREIPFSKVTILKDISQVVDIKAGGIKRKGREFFILSKDFAKLSYQKKPLPRSRRKGFLKIKQCGDCRKNIWTVDNVCKCGCKDIRFVNSDIQASSMICPSCKNLLVPYETNNFNAEQKVLDFDAFTNNRVSNDKCYYCGESLWAPHVPNIGENKHNVWYRATHYTNKSHKGTNTVWVHDSYAKQYFHMIGEQPLNVIDAETHFGIRKVSPAYFIKRQLKGYFDFAVFDEAHLYKGAGTAQGNAMHSFIKASKKQLALTGTIAGGYASHLFYLLYRLDPGRMQRAGYDWTGVMRFVDKYGQKETEYEYDESYDGVYNTSSRGRQMGSAKEKPGISPLIFTDFLLDSAVFLDLSDMSKYLPPLKEFVETVDISDMIEDADGNLIENPEMHMKDHYMLVLDSLQKLCTKKNGRTLMSSMLQFGLSYLDRPYGAEPIVHPITGDSVVVPKHFVEFQNNDTLLSKEKRLIELINKEQAEGRNCFVFAEYTGNPSICVTSRLKTIIEHHCNLKGKVAILEASSPCASEREEWMHKKAAEGIRVFITNPKNVETGLDFCFKKEGVLYNYPTLIFYQLGYSLFTIWQASRRHFRLNQREECRTYYMAVSGTIQQTVISLIAQKMAATSAIQGKFSVEGLSSMAQGIDVKLKLAQSLAKKDTQSGANLQQMFDVLQSDDANNDMFGDYRMMLTLEELVGDVINTLPSDTFADDDDFINVFDIFDILDSMDEKLAGGISNSTATDISEKNSFSKTLSVTMDAPDAGFTKKSFKKVPTGQMSLFGF